MKTEYEYILEVFKTGSFSKAAQMMCTPKTGRI